MYYWEQTQCLFTAFTLRYLHPASESAKLMTKLPQLLMLILWLHVTMHTLSVGCEWWHRSRERTSTTRKDEIPSALKARFCNESLLTTYCRHYVYRDVKCFWRLVTDVSAVLNSLVRLSLVIHDNGAILPVYRKHYARAFCCAWRPTRILPW